MCEHEIWDLVFALRYYLFHSYFIFSFTPSLFLLKHHGAIGGCFLRSHNMLLCGPCRCIPIISLAILPTKNNGVIEHTITNTL